MIEIEVDKDSIGYKELMSLWWKDKAIEKKIIDYAKYYFDNWKIISDKNGHPSYIESKEKPDMTVWAEVEGGYAPINPPKVWKVPFAWTNDNISKIIVGAGVYLVLKENKIIRGFLVKVNGEDIIIKCDKTVLKYFKLKEGFTVKGKG